MEVYTFSDRIPEACLDEAACWIARLDSERCDDADRRAFIRWLGESRYNAPAFVDLATSWAKFRVLRELEHLGGASNVVRFPGAGGALFCAAPELGDSGAPGASLGWEIAQWSVMALILAAVLLGPLFIAH